ncbi:TonB family protein [Methylocystis echinoides]|uniref:TonB C-terminal domain-containing protein n=1 Tax=Methylocystis echinoides TaxID=29468 RepID=A0A9W6GS50_9HYPH|nr:TonB family protein [Methylocystis echinoides]GLI91909.1 hypothetical protein LMG27198_09010 [Methylocystis echinoides]
MNETVRQKPRGAAFAAVAMERLFDPRIRGAVASRPRFLAFLALGLLLHLTILAFLLWEDKRMTPPPAEEIAVEVITEPPPPEPPPQPEEKKEEPPPPEPEKQQQEKQKPPPPPPPPPEKLEEPATDAPKLESKAKSEQDAPEEQKEAKTPRKDQPTEKVVPKDEKPEGLKDAEDDADGDKKAKPAPLKEVEDKPDAEVIEQAEKTPKPDKPTPDAAKPAKKGEGKSIAEQVAALAPLPDFKLAAPPKTSPVGGGQAKTTYLTILYGLIMPHMRIPPRVREIQMSSKGVVAFYIDEMGNLTHQAVYKTSGLPDLDAAALAAVRAAAPFPPPPRGLPRAMLFSYATK